MKIKNMPTHVLIAVLAVGAGIVFPIVGVLPLTRVMQTREIVIGALIMSAIGFLSVCCIGYLILREDLYHERHSR